MAGRVTDAGLTGIGVDEGKDIETASGGRVEVGFGTKGSGVAVAVTVGVIVGRGWSFLIFKSLIKMSCDVPS